MKHHTTKGIGITLAVVVVVLVAANYLLFRAIRSAGLQVSQVEQNIASLQAQIIEFSQYQPEELISLADSVNAKIIPRGDFVEFIEMVEKAARAQGVQVEVESVDETPRSDDPNDDKQIAHLRLETHASWAETMRFIQYVEHLPYKVGIVNLVLAKTDSSDPKVKAGGWHGRFEITALKFK